VLVLITFLGPILTYMPMAAMAGTLFIVGADMIKWRDVKHYAPVRSELVIYLLTFIGIVFFGLTAGIVIAVLLSVSVFLLHISQLEMRVTEDEDDTLIKVKGALFYASVAPLTEIFQSHIGENLTVDLQYTTHIDQSAADFFIREANNLAAHGARLKLLVNNRQRYFLQDLGVGANIEMVSI